ncbi:MAG: DUF2480 family protein [Cyclobacteriaceae bacterium]|nr:MAG: DUF2480 family protein [Cyclobacteriaceae bacterium]
MINKGDEIINRVSASGLITFDLETFYQQGERISLDIKDQLFQGLVLREKDFRDFVKSHDWKQYQDKFVAITCSTDAIVPIWAYMLIATALRPYARLFFFGSLERLEEKIFEQQLSEVDWQEFKNKKVVVKGCSKVEVPVSIYLEVVRQLLPLVSSLMFGEPCSTVPLFKVPKQTSDKV